MCIAQGPQRSDAGEARTRGPLSRVKHSTTEPLKVKTLKFILSSFSMFFFCHSYITHMNVFDRVSSETTWFGIMKSSTILSLLWKCYNHWWLPTGACELCSLLAIFQSVFLISHCNADFGCSIYWVVLAIQLTGWFVVFSGLGSLPCISGLQPLLDLGFWNCVCTFR